MATEYMDAPEVRKIANRVINEFHPHLNGVRIDYVFASKTDKDGTPQPITSKGRHIHGKAQKVSGLNAFLASKFETPDAEEFFVITISHYSWSYFSPDQRIALVDHELCHCALGEETGTPELRPHDVEEFTEIVKRRGLWLSDVELFAKVAVKQLPLEFQPEAKPANGNGKPVADISIDLDKKCSRCKKKGASQNGMCLSCTTKAMNNGEFDHVIKPSDSITKAVRKVHAPAKGQ